MTFSKQLEIYLQRRFGSAGDKRMMAEQSGIDYDYFVAILAGSRNPPSEEKIIEMGKRLKLTDEEVGLLLALSLKAKAKFPETRNVLDRALAYGESSGDVRFIELPKTDYHIVPVWASVQAGAGQLTEQNAEVVDEVLIAEEECLQTEIDSIELRQAKLLEELELGDFPRDLLKARMESLQAKRKGLLAQVEDLKKDAAMTNVRPGKKDPQEFCALVASALRNAEGYNFATFLKRLGVKVKLGKRAEIEISPVVMTEDNPLIGAGDPRPPKGLTPAKYRMPLPGHASKADHSGMV